MGLRDLLPRCDRGCATAWRRRYGSGCGGRFGGYWSRRNWIGSKPVPTANAIESLHSQVRKAVRNKAHFPSDEAATKLIYLAPWTQRHDRLQDPPKSDRLLRSVGCGLILPPGNPPRREAAITARADACAHLCTFVETLQPWGLSCPISLQSSTSSCSRRP